MPKGANYAEMEAGFGKGEIAMMINGPWAWDNAQEGRHRLRRGPDPDRRRQARPSPSSACWAA